MSRPKSKLTEDEKRMRKREAVRKWRRIHHEEHHAKCRKFIADNPDKARAYWYKQKHKEPIENKIARLEAQGYKCANSRCRKPIDITTGHQDHNHLTNEQRGVLCNDCNAALGFLKDSAEMARGIASYRELFQ